MKLIVKLLLLLVVTYVQLNADARITFSLSNHTISNGCYYVDLYANVPSETDKWTVANSTIVIKFNEEGLNLDTLSGVAVINLDSDLSNAGYSVSQDYWDGGFLSVGLFKMSPLTTKSGNFKFCTVRWTIENSTKYDSLKFDGSQSIVTNSSTELTYGCSTVSCFLMTDPSPKLLQASSIPTLSTTNISSITSTTASSGGNITSDGGASVTSRGVCWSTSQNPTTSNSKTTDGSGTGTFTSSITGLTADTTYYVRAYAVNSVGTAYGDQKSFTTDTSALYDVPDEWDFALTQDNAVIIVPKNINPKIGNRDLDSGDAIGVFYKVGNEYKCGGYKIWKNASLDLVAWQDDSQTQVKDGFSINELFTIKIWDAKLGKEYFADVTYSNGPDNYQESGLSYLSKLEAILTETHNLPLKSGWNLISTYINPINDSITVIWEPIESNVVIVKNASGGNYIPSYDIDGIITWKFDEAYKVYMSTDDTLSIVGDAFKPSETPIILNSNWKLVPYLRKSNMDVEDALTSLTESGSLLIAKNLSGGNYIPSYDINSLGDLLPGQGYQMYLSKLDTLIYPANSSGRAAPKQLTPVAKYILPEFKETGNSSVLLLEIDGPNGNEVVVYNASNQVIGSGAVHNNKSVITIWGDNERTSEIDGASNNDKLRIMNYDYKTGRMSEVQLNDLVDAVKGENVNDLAYTEDAFYIAKAKVLDNSINLSLQITPNPARDNIEITLEGDATDASLILFNNEGKQVADLSSEILTMSGNKLRYNTTNLSSGSYNLILSTGTNKIMQQLLIVK